jgi:hypothetical protein
MRDECRLNQRRLDQFLEHRAGDFEVSVARRDVDRNATTEIVRAVSNPFRLLVVSLCLALIGCSKQKESLVEELKAAQAIVAESSAAFQDVAALQTSTRHVGERYAAVKGKLAAESRAAVESAFEALKTFETSCSISEKERELAVLSGSADDRADFENERRFQAAFASRQRQRKANLAAIADAKAQLADLEKKDAGKMAWWGQSERSKQRDQLHKLIAEKEKGNLQIALDDARADERRLDNNRKHQRSVAGDKAAVDQVPRRGYFTTGNESVDGRLSIQAEQERIDAQLKVLEQIKIRLEAEHRKLVEERLRFEATRNEVVRKLDVAARAVREEFK